MAGLHFDITADNSDFRAKLAQIEKGVSSTSKVLQSVGKNFDVSTIESRVTALNKVIKDNETSMAALAATIKRYSEEASRAASEGDSEQFSVISKDIVEQQVELKKLTDETERYRQALSMVEGYGGLAASTQEGAVQSPMFFDTEESYTKAKVLRQEISDLQQQISEFDGNDAGLMALNDSLTEAQDRLREMEGAAAETASSLGAELGGQAAEVSVRLYELNAAVQEQSSVVADMTARVEEARNAFLSAQSDGNVEAVELARTEYESLSAALQNAQNELYNLQAAQADAHASMRHVTNAVDLQNSALVKMLGGTENFNAAMQMLPTPVRSAITSVNSLTKASLKFIATPVGAILAAIVLALKAVSSWFKSSADGQLKFAEVSGYVSGILGKLKEVVVDVGEAIYKAFTNPKQAITGLWDTIKTGFLDRIQALAPIAMTVGKVIKSAFSLDFDSAKEAIGDLADQMAALIKGDWQKVSNWFNSVGDAAKASSRIAVREKELELEEARWEIRKQEIERQMNEASMKMYDTNATKSARAKALDDYKSLLTEESEQEKKFAAEHVALQRERMSLSPSTIEDYKELSRLEAQLASVDTRAAQRLAMLQRRSNSINRVGNAGGQADSELKLAQQNQQAELDLMDEGAAKRLAKIEAQYATEVDAIKKQAEAIRKANEDAGVKEGLNESGLTAQQQAEVDKAYELTEEKRKRSINEVYQAEADAMRAYLMEYGTYEEKKLATAQEYAEKIAKAQTEGERLQLEKQKSKALMQVEVDAAKQAIDWQSMFGGLGDMLQSQIEPMLENLRTFMSSDEFKRMQLSDQKALYDALSELELRSGSLKSNFEAMGLALTSYRSAMLDYGDAIERQTKAAEALVDAQERLNAAANEEEAANAREQVDMAQEAYERATEEVDALAESVQENAVAVSDASATVKSSLNGLAQGLSQLSSGSLSQALEGLKKLGGIIGGSIGKSLSSIDSTGIIGGVLSIFDVLAEDGLTGIITSLIDTLFGLVTNILQEVLTGSLLTDTVGSLFDGVTGVLDTLTFGLFGNGSNAKEVAEITEKLTNSNTGLQNAVEDLTEEIESLSGMLALESYEEAIAAQEQVIEQTREILEAQMGYHSAHHSNSYYWSREWDADDYAEVNAALVEYAKKNGTTASTVSSLTEMMSLSPEELDYLRSYYVDLWDKIISTGEYDKSEYWEALADLAGTIEEIEDTLKESLTQTTYDSLYDSFVDALMDMDAEAEDFADDLSEYLMRAVLNAQLSDLLSEQMEEFYDKWAELMSDDDYLTEDEIAELQAMWNDMVEQGMSIRDAVAAITGYDTTSSQTASSGTYETMSQDQAEELSGRFTAVQVAAEAVRAQVAEGVAVLTAMSATTTECNSALNSILLQSVAANSYLEDIAGYQKKIHALIGEDIKDTLTDIKKQLA